jgi:hypothetical protein
MAAVILDTGALIAIDRGDRRVGAMLHEAARGAIPPVKRACRVLSRESLSVRWTREPPAHAGRCWRNRIQATLRTPPLQ